MHIPADKAYLVPVGYSYFHVPEFTQSVFKAAAAAATCDEVNTGDHLLAVAA